MPYGCVICARIFPLSLSNILFLRGRPLSYSPYTYFPSLIPRLLLVSSLWSLHGDYQKHLSHLKVGETIKPAELVQLMSKPRQVKGSP